MLEQKVIKKSYGPWALPVVIVMKKDGSTKFYINYRALNEITETDSYPMPKIDDLMDSFKQAKYFTSLDLASGYWQIEMEEQDKPKTAFVCSQGKYECERMPFRLKNAPATFQRVMNETFEEYIHEFVVVYIDDIMIYPKTNGLVERFNKTLCESLAKLAEQGKNWDLHISPVLFAYRTKKHSTTKVEPFYLTYGRNARLPIDNEEKEETYEERINQLIQTLPVEQEKAKQQSLKNQKLQKKYHDKNITIKKILK
jgi:hypothetical protein